MNLGLLGITEHIGPSYAVDLMALHEVTAAPGSEHMRMETPKQWCGRICVDRGVAFSKLATIYRTQRPDKYRLFAEPAHMTASIMYQPAPHQVAAPTPPWQVYSPRATGMTLYEVFAEVVDQRFTAMHNTTREHWAHEIVGAPFWLRSQQLSVDLVSIGIGPVEQPKESVVYSLMATPGPKEGAPFLF